jgi:hypothetical protein
MSDGSIGVTIGRHRFHDVSVFVDRFVYRFERRGDGWTLNGVTPDPWNRVEPR